MVLYNRRKRLLYRQVEEIMIQLLMGMDRKGPSVSTQEMLLEEDLYTRGAHQRFLREALLRITIDPPK